MYKTKELGFNYNSLEPYISEVTLRNQYKIYENHVNNLNNLIDVNIPLKKIITEIDTFDIQIRDDILYHVGGILNHEMYFNTIKPSNTKISYDLNERIEKKYGSMNNFYNEFKRTASYLIGSGYTYVILNNGIEIINVSNEDNPYMYDVIPLFNMDLWEHAYYLDYGINKDNYINNFLNLLNFEYINEIYDKNK